MIGFVLMLAAVPLDPPDTIPLALPPPIRRRVQPQTVVKEADFHRQPEPTPFDKQLFVGAGGQGFVGSGALRGGGGGALSVGYRFPFWEKQLGVAFEPSIVGLASAGEAFDAAGYWIGLPVSLFWNRQVFGAGALRVAAALSVDYVLANADGTSLARTDRFWTLGGSFGAGYWLPLGPGMVSADVRYRMLSYSVANQKQLAHGVLLTIGYAYFIL